MKTFNPPTGDRLSAETESGSVAWWGFRPLNGLFTSCSLLERRLSGIRELGGMVLGGGPGVDQWLIGGGVGREQV